VLLLPYDTAQVIYIFPAFEVCTGSGAKRKVKYSNERNHRSVGQTVISLGMMIPVYQCAGAEMGRAFFTLIPTPTPARALVLFLITSI